MTGRGDASSGLGAAIREAREKAGMSLRALAGKLKLSAPFLSDVEHGRRGIAKLAELAAILGVTEDSLASRSEVMTRAEQAWINAHPEILRLLRERRRREDYPGPRRSHPPQNRNRKYVGVNRP